MECGGSAVEDECGVCSGGNTSHEANSDKDDCDVCFGNNEDMDCSGNCDGLAILDKCGVCDGQNLPSTGTCDCTGEPNGDAVVDECGVCDGGNVCTGGNTLTAIISDHELISSMEAVLDSDPYVDQGTGWTKRDVKSITVNLTDGNSYTMIRDEENSDSGD